MRPVRPFAYDYARRVEVVRKRFSFAQEFRAEDHVFGVEPLAYILQKADWHGRFDDDGRSGIGRLGLMNNGFD